MTPGPAPKYSNFRSKQRNKAKLLIVSGLVKKLK